jgi:uncharacterized protein involved in cysteine biosynthesis
MLRTGTIRISRAITAGVSSAAYGMPWPRSPCFVLLWVVTIPLWLLGPLAAPVPLLLSAYVNQRLFRYDALSDHANAAEMKQIFDLSRGRLFLLGLITGLLYFIPPLNLIAPIYAALAFIHFCLAGTCRRSGQAKAGLGTQDLARRVYGRSPVPSEVGRDS